MAEHILYAYTLDGHGGGKSIAHGDVVTSLSEKTKLWIHMDVTHEDTRSWMLKNLPFLDKNIIDALLEEETRPRVAHIDDGTLMILRGVNLNENARPEDMVSIRLWVDKTRIISVRRRKLKAVVDMETALKEGHGPKNTGQFTCMLVDKLFRRMEPVLSELDETADDIEEQVLENADSSLREGIINVRKQAIVFRRYMAPQRDALGQLLLADVKWLDTAHKRDLQESYNRITRYVEDLEAVRERAQIVKDELSNILADKLNKNMYMLSVIAAIFLPLGFLTGLLGINVGGIPGAENPYGFEIFAGILTIVVIFQVYLFKKLKWF